MKKTLDFFTVLYNNIIRCGGVAQRSEHSVHTRGVSGSNPLTATIMARWRSGLTHQPFTLAFRGSNPLRVTIHNPDVLQHQVFLFL